MRQTNYSAFLLGVFLVAGPALAAPDADAQKAIALFKIAFEGRCAEDAFTPGYLDDTEGVAFTYRMSDDASGAEYKSTIYTFFCDRFHNAGSAAFVFKNSDGKFQVLSFAMPSGKWSSDPNAPNGLRYDGLQGFMTTDTLINGEFSVDGLTIFSGNHESLGDYYNNYRFIDGSFQFVESELYEIKNGKLELKPPPAEDQEQ